MIAATTWGCSSAPVATTVEWQGHALREVRSLADLPDSIQSRLGVGRHGVEGIADRGRPFNVTDVADPRLPMRRFLTAGNDGDTWLVAFEQGGRAHFIKVLHFSADDPTLREHWVLPNRPRNLADVIRGISKER